MNTPKGSTVPNDHPNDNNNWRTLTLISRARRAGIEIPHQYDDEIAWEFRSAMEDALFQLDQRDNQIAYLQRKLETMGRAARIRKQEELGERDRQPSKR